MKAPAIVLMLSTAACATPPRFQDRPIVWAVDDTRDIPKPDDKDFYRFEYMTNVFFMRRMTRALELRTTTPARSTNALDEAPSSTWFTNRIHTITATRAARGAGKEGPPRPPYVVVGGKSGGGNPGFVVEDSSGRRFIVKFDPKGNPEMQTATDVIVSRLFWAMGWNTPANYIAIIDRKDLTIGPDARYKDDLGRKEPLTEVQIDDALASSPRLADGRYRTLASEFIRGGILGGILPEGVREDDPNDTIPHEHRRELRGLIAPAAWLNHTDMKEDNLLDAWVEEDGRHFVRHYLVDFGEAFAAHAAEKGRPEDGYEYFLDWWALLRGTFALGLWTREWEAVVETPWLSIGGFGEAPFDPWTWREAYPFWPFFEADSADRYWGAKLVMAVDRRTIEAVVQEGQLSSPEAAAYLVDVLVARQKMVGHAFLDNVSPLDDFEIRDGQLCGRDLARTYGIADHGVVEVLGTTGDEEVRRAVTVHADGAFCFALEGRGYVIHRLRARRGDTFRPVMQLHVMLDDRPRILGLVRVEPSE